MMDISAYKGEEGGEEVEQKPKSVRQKVEQPRPVRGLEMAAKRVGAREDVDRKQDFVTKKQVYEILRNSYRSDRQDSVDVGQSNREMYQEYRKRELQSKALEEQAAERRAMQNAERRKA